MREYRLVYSIGRGYSWFFGGGWEMSIPTLTVKRTDTYLLHTCSHDQ